MKRFIFALTFVLLVLLPLGAQASVSQVDGTWRYRAIIDTTAARYDLPAGMIQAIMSVESGGNPDALSSSGAIGLMQVMPFWFSPSEDAWDPTTNINRAAQILGMCKWSTGRWWRPGDDWVETINCYRYGHVIYGPTAYSEAVRANWQIVAEAENHWLTYP